MIHRSLESACRMSINPLFSSCSHSPQLVAYRHILICSFWDQCFAISYFVIVVLESFLVIYFDALMGPPLRFIYFARFTNCFNTTFVVCRLQRLPRLLSYRRRLRATCDQNLFWYMILLAGKAAAKKWKATSKKISALALERMTSSFPRARGFDSVIRKVSVVDTISTDHSDLGPIIACRKTRILSCLAYFATVKTSFETTVLGAFMYLRPFSLMQIGFEFQGFFLQKKGRCCANSDLWRRSRQICRPHARSQRETKIVFPDF